MSASPAQLAVEHAEKIAALLRTLGIDSALIGGAALAAYSYVRATDDIDLGTSVDVWTKLRDATEALKAAGYQATLEYPDASDSLGGVVTVTAPGSNPVQIVNFLNPYSGGAGAFAREAIELAQPVEGLQISVIPLAHLIALKLYAGGAPSLSDVAELLSRNPMVNRANIRDVCDRLGVGDLFAKMSDAQKSV